MQIILTNEECNVLDKIATQTKMDCWFFITTVENKENVIYDIENQTPLSNYEGISMLNEGIVAELLSLTEEEINVYVNLLNKLNIKENPFHLS